MTRCKQGAVSEDKACVRPSAGDLHHIGHIGDHSRGLLLAECLVRSVRIGPTRLEFAPFGFGCPPERGPK